MTWLLRPGIGLARRDADHLQLGVDPPLAAVLPDSPAVRVLLVELAHGSPLSTLDAITAPVLDLLVQAGLVVARDEEAERRRRRAACVVHVEAPDGLVPSVLRLAAAAGLRCTPAAERATVALVWSEGEPSRERLDRWMRTSSPHLLVREVTGGVVVGPYVVPGRTACVRCLDAHLAERDPRRAFVVEQQATTPPLRAAEPDPALRALAAAWAVQDLGTAAEGGTPATWSAIVELTALPPRTTTFHRHLHCGCAWAEELVS